MPERHQLFRVKQEPRRRRLEVVGAEYLGPRMRRIHLQSEALKDFDSPSPDDHVKLFFPVQTTGGDDAAGFVMRDFTPRYFDTTAGTLSLDFALHETGPATAWAVEAKVGDHLEIGGPRGSSILPDDFDWYLLIGDETALPSIGRRIETFRADVPVCSIVVIPSAAEEQTVETKAVWSAHWLHRDQMQGEEAAAIEQVLSSLTLPPGEGFIWIASEASVAKRLRAHVIEQMNHPKGWVNASGYWKLGAHSDKVIIADD